MVPCRVFSSVDRLNGLLGSYWYVISGTEKSPDKPDLYNNGFHTGTK